MYKTIGVSSDLSVQLISPAIPGDILVVECVVLKKGKTLTFTHTKIHVKSSGKICAMGSHTKMSGGVL